MQTEEGFFQFVR